MSATPPAWAINMVGQAINPATDPILASRYPSGFVPDHRAMTVRGWDNGRGIDAGRVLLSQQEDAIRNITASGLACMQAGGTSWPNGAIVSNGNNYPATGNVASGPNTLVISGFDASKVVPTAHENRIKSLAYNIISMRG